MTRVYTTLETTGAEVVPVITVQKDDRQRQGIWYKAGGGTLFFYEKPHEGAHLSDGNGAVGGAASGNPVQMIFWGSWWGTADGADLRNYLDGAMIGLLLSPYFDELKQYRVVHAPVWRGDSLAITNSEPDVHRTGDTSSTYLDHVKDLVADLMDEGRLPGPNDATHICFLVVMPPGFDASNAGGSHGRGYAWDFPFDVDTYWVGWVEHTTDRDLIMRMLSHELVEMLTDPSASAWRWDPPPAEQITEISDAREPLTAWVGGASVQAYWSQRHLVNLIPLDNDYGAQLTGQIKETRRQVVVSNTFAPSPEDSAACSPSLPDCCFGDEVYEWRLYHMDEVARIRLHARRFKMPKVEWRINGNIISGETDLTLTAQVQLFTGGRSPMVDTRSVTLHVKPVTFALAPGNVPFEWVAAGLDISVTGLGANFEIDVSCTVKEAAISGTPMNPPTAFPKLTVDFVCTEILLADEYLAKLGRCYASMLKRYVELYKPTGRPGKGEPINTVADLLREVTLPAYVRPSRYAALLDASKLARAANTMLEPAQAERFVQALIDRAPELTLAARSRLRRLLDSETGGN